MFKGLYLDGTGWATTTNPNITGDLTVIVELWKEIWETGVKENLACVYETSGGERSWYLDIDNGSNQLEFGWSTDGAVASSFAADIPDSFKTVDFTAFKMEFDSDPGTVELFAAETEAGPWTLLGTHNIGSITTLFSSSADLIVGMLRPSDPARLLTNAVVKKVQVYSSVGTGTPVVDADFDAETRGTTSFTDGQGNTVTLSPNAAIVDGQTPELGLHLPDPTDTAKDWAVTAELSRLNAEAIDAFVGNREINVVNATITYENSATELDSDGEFQEARWFQIGDLVFVWIDVEFGPSPTIGTGNVLFELPVAADGSFHSFNADEIGTGDVVGEGFAADNSDLINRIIGSIELRNANEAHFVIEEGYNRRVIDSNDPFVPANGDNWGLNLVYKAAP